MSLNKSARLETVDARSSRLYSRLPHRDHRSFHRVYHIWNQLHAVVAIVLALLAQVSSTRTAALTAMVVWMPIALISLHQLGKYLHPDGTGVRLANALTGVRAVTGVGLLALVALSASGSIRTSFSTGVYAFWLALVLLAVELTDFFDGRVARRRAAGGFGSFWDMESDCVFAFAIAVALVEFYGVGVHVLAIGLMKFVYVVVTRFDGDPPDPPRAYKLYAKTVTAVLVTTLIVAMFPFVPHVARQVGAAILLALQTVSFAWDFLIRYTVRSHDRGLTSAA